MDSNKDFAVFLQYDLARLDTLFIFNRTGY